YGGEARFFFVGERGVDFSGRLAISGLGESQIAGKGTFDVWGIEANWRCKVDDDAPDPFYRVDAFAGARYLQLNGSLNTIRRTTFASAVPDFPQFQPLAGSQAEQAASFNAHDHFVGGQIGLAAKLFMTQCFEIGCDVRLALGPNFQDASVSGVVRTT